MGNKQGVSAKKASGVLNEDEIQLLLNNTHFNRNQIVEWHTGFIVSYLSLFHDQLYYFTSNFVMYRKIVQKEGWIKKVY